MRISYRRWNLEDAVHVRRILHDTWMDAYVSFIPIEDLDRYLDDHYNVDALQIVIEDSNTVGFISEVDGVAAGCEKTYFNIEEQRLYVQQLYIIPQFQGLGIGKQLMAFAGERARTFNLDRVWLGVMVENTSALTWYQNMGYQIVERVPFVMGKTTVDHYIGYVLIDDIFRSSSRKL